MALEYVWKGLLVVAALSIVGVVLVQAGVVSAPWGPDSGEVRVFDDEDGESAAEADNETANESDGDREPKAVVDVEIADSRPERRTGLSDHDSLESGNGMLFIHGDESDLTYVMREMDFDIDIIFIDADGEITSIHHARSPGPNEDGNDLEYSGRGQFVLEVPRGYANETGIEVGDEVEIDLESKQTIITDGESGSLNRVAATADREVTAPTAATAATYFGS
ncbi:DUF192 domain-containing protein [Natrinema versiforme]|uniref:DUF192 domain-containing protein n=1 Tax=Natrinema versiforme JCM 10478 TaxID=1227496 RepID=L9YF19_9EURY|nr:DUF192 domain-containing protein [Natrinema versiforme]ELY71523.1 hypothetical protein C489_00080 [Natrinema versiforme JCM 10478]